MKEEDRTRAIIASCVGILALLMVFFAVGGAYVSCTRGGGVLMTTGVCKGVDTTHYKCADLEDYYQPTKFGDAHLFDLNVSTEERAKRRAEAYDRGVLDNTKELMIDD